MITNLPGTQGITLVCCQRTNCYLLETDQGLMLVDAGWGVGPDVVVRALDEAGFLPQDLILIVLTHAHFDHFDFANALQKRTGARVAAHQADAPYFEKGGPGIFPPRLDSWIHKRERLEKKRLHAPGVGVDVLLKESDLLADWQVIHTPGHTPGTISLYSENRKVLITGGWAVPGRSQMKNNRPKEPLIGLISTDPQQLTNSRIRLAQLDFQALLCSHFPPRLFPVFARRLKALAS